jgi:hypothetical protein
MRKFALLLASAGLTAGLLAGCSSSGGGDSTGSDSAGKAPLSERQSAPRIQKDARNASADKGLSNSDSVNLGLDQASQRAAGKQAPKPPSAEEEEPTDKIGDRNRKLARTASMKLRAKDIDEAAADARAIAAKAGGYVGSEESREKSVSLTLTVPGTKLDSVLDDLEQLGERVEREIGVKDVTEAVVDVNSRVETQRRSVTRARALLDRAQTIHEILRIEQQLASREARLESLLKRQELLRGQVAMAPIVLSILPVKTQAAAEKDNDEPGGFVAGLAVGWNAFTKALAAGMTALGAAAPFLLTLGIPALIVLWVLRRRRPARPVQES